MADLFSPADVLLTRARDVLLGDILPCVDEGGAQAKLRAICELLERLAIRERVAARPTLPADEIMHLAQMVGTPPSAELADTYAAAVTDLYAKPEAVRKDALAAAWDIARDNYTAHQSFFPRHGK